MSYGMWVGGWLVCLRVEGIGMPKLVLPRVRGGGTEVGLSRSPHLARPAPHPPYPAAFHFF